MSNEDWPNKSIEFFWLLVDKKIIEFIAKFTLKKENYIYKYEYYGNVGS